MSDEVEFLIPIPLDDEQMLGRECPSCGQYFKIRPGTGLPIETCRCPYCGFQDNQKSFATKEQLEYAMSIGMNTISKELVEPLVRDWDRELRRTTRNSFLKMSVDFRHRPVPISYYREKSLETHVECSNCGLHFAIYGVFATCPDCGDPNALDIFLGALTIAEKRVALLADFEDPSLQGALLEDALGAAVAAFDALGKDTRKRFPNRLPSNPKNLFQNLSALRLNLRDLAMPENRIRLQDWETIEKWFQVRHLIEHTLGVVDEAFVQKVEGTQHLLHRKYPLTQEDIEGFIHALRRVGIAVANWVSESEVDS